jgi:hypothetical protein
VPGTVVADTGQLPPAGGTRPGYAGIVNVQGPGFSLRGPTVPGAAATAHVSGGLVGSTPTVSGDATLLNFDLTVHGVLIHGDTVQSEVTEQCVPAASGFVLVRQGQPWISGLQVNGTPVSVTGAPNQVVALPNNVGTLTLHELTVDTTSITLTAVHLHTADGRDFLVAFAQASLRCDPPHQCSTCAVTGHAAGANVNGELIAPVTACNQSPGSVSPVNRQGPDYSLTAPTVPGAAALASVTCTPTEADSTGTMLNFTLTVHGVTIHADTVEADATAQCPTSAAAPHGRAHISGLRVNGQPLPAQFDGSSTQTLVLPNNAGTLTVDEQIVAGSSLTVNAIDVHTAGGSSIVLGTASAGSTSSTVPCPPGPQSLDLRPEVA